MKQYYISYMFVSMIQSLWLFKKWRVEMKQWHLLADGWQGVLYDKDHDTSYVITVAPVKSIKEVVGNDGLTEKEFERMWGEA